MQSLADAETVATPLSLLLCRNHDVVNRMYSFNTYETGRSSEPHISAGLKLPEEFPVENSNGGVFRLCRTISLGA